jgi:hypothetical protein
MKLQKVSICTAKNSGGPNFERELGQQRGEEGDRQHGEEGADEGRGEGRRQRLGGAALLRQRKAVEGGGHRPGFAGDVEQDGSDRPAEQRAPVDAGEHDDGRGRVHREGQRQQDGDTVGAAQAGQHADQDAQQQAEQHEAQVGQGHRHGEALEQAV